MESEKFVVCKTALNVEKYGEEFCASINPYLGCLHKCKYCYVRAEKYSKGKNLEVVKVKYNIIELLLKELPKYLIKFNAGIIYLGTSSDPYQPVEQKYHISKRILSILFNHTPYNIHIFTKSKYILDDIDLLKNFKNRINISITLITTNEKIKDIFEPNASSIAERLDCIKTLNLEGINCGISLMPIIPYITDKDKDLENLIISAKNSFCKYIWWGYLTLRDNIKNANIISQKEVFYSILYKQFSLLVERYRILYKNSILPNKNYQKFIDKKIIVLAKKYNIPYFGPKWEKTQYQLFFNF